MVGPFHCWGTNESAIRGSPRSFTAPAFIRSRSPDPKPASPSAMRRKVSARICSAGPVRSRYTAGRSSEALAAQCSCNPAEQTQSRQRPQKRSPSDATAEPARVPLSGGGVLATTSEDVGRSGTGMFVQSGGTQTVTNLLKIWNTGARRGRERDTASSVDRSPSAASTPAAIRCVSTGWTAESKSPAPRCRLDLPGQSGLRSP